MSAKRRHLRSPAALASLCALLTALPAASACARPGQIVEYPLSAAESRPIGIATGPEGDLWLTDPRAKAIDRVTETGKVTEFPVPAGLTYPTGIATGPDGNLWFTAREAIGRITPEGQITSYPLPSPRRSGYYQADAESIVAGPDGNMWFTGKEAIGRITPAGQITELPVPGTESLSITAGPRGDLWFTMHVGKIGFGGIGRITSRGEVVESPIPPRTEPVRSGGGLGGIAAGPDGNLWIADSNDIIRSNETYYRLHRFQIPKARGEEWPPFAVNIARGPDGNLWFTEQEQEGDGVGLGRIAPTGQITRFPLSQTPAGVTAGPDGDVWFTAYSGKQVRGVEHNEGYVGRITPGLLALTVFNREPIVRRGAMRLVLGCAGGGPRSSCRGRIEVSQPALGPIAITRYRVPSGTRRGVRLVLNHRRLRTIANNYPLLGYAKINASVRGGLRYRRGLMLRLRRPVLRP
jgi:streptogramin lyase